MLPIISNKKLGPSRVVARCPFTQTFTSRWVVRKHSFEGNDAPQVGDHALYITSVIRTIFAAHLSTDSKINTSNYT